MIKLYSSHFLWFVPYPEMTQKIIYHFVVVYAEYTLQMTANFPRLVYQNNNKKDISSGKYHTVKYPISGRKNVQKSMKLDVRYSMMRMLLSFPFP